MSEFRSSLLSLNCKETRRRKGEERSNKLWGVLNLPLHLILQWVVFKRALPTLWKGVCVCVMVNFVCGLSFHRVSRDFTLPLT
jgi:hypothetical protein